MITQIVVMQPLIRSPVDTPFITATQLPRLRNQYKESVINWEEMKNRHKGLLDRFLNKRR